jgi:ABC-type Fe3+/spermidine/putrescine transport system ATPase subunit
MTVAQNIGFPLRMRGISPNQRRPLVERALGLVQLEGLGSRYPDQLSGGQQQRVALARAIVFRPTLLLMDEPLGALDKKLREHMRVEIKMLQRRLGSTVVYVTHDQGEALTMADRVAVMSDGLLHQVGPPEDLYERPATAFVADFVGETNFLEGTMAVDAEGRAGVILEADPGGVCWPAANADSVGSGLLVRIGVRPEWMTLAHLGGIDGPALSGEVVEVLYEGASALYVVDTPAGTVNARISARAREHSRWGIGDRVDVSWDLEAARVYPLEGGDGEEAEADDVSHAASVGGHAAVGGHDRSNSEVTEREER